MAANVAAMSPGTAIGAAHPVDSSGQDINGDERDKVTNFSIALIQSIAKQRGRNVTWAGEAVKTSKSATAQEAVELQVIDLVANDLNDLLNKIDGKAVKTVAGEFTLHTQRIGIVNIDMNIFELFLHTIVDPTIALILLQMGLLAIVVEIYNPGATIPAIIGAICLVMAFVALGNLPVNWGGVIFIVLSVVLFILDIKVTGFALTVGGVIMFILGAILLFTPLTPVAPTMPTVSVNPFVIIGLGLAMGAFFFFILGAAVRGRNMPVVTGTLILLNAVGVALSDLAPSGIVRVKSEEWTAEAEGGTIHKGDSVRVVGIEGLRLKVVKQ
jgi:membrane-bound serine protease (ClpP class)